MKGKTMLLCQLLLGRPYNMNGVIQTGCGLKPGYIIVAADCWC